MSTYLFISNVPTLLAPPQDKSRLARLVVPFPLRRSLDDIPPLSDRTALLPSGLALPSANRYFVGLDLRVRGPRYADLVCFYFYFYLPFSPTPHETEQLTQLARFLSLQPHLSLIAPLAPSFTTEPSPWTALARTPPAHSGTRLSAFKSDDARSNKSWCIVDQSVSTLWEINQMEHEMCSALSDNSM